MHQDFNRFSKLRGMNYLFNPVCGLGALWGYETCLMVESFINRF